MADSERRRRRIRHAPPAAETSAVHDPEGEPASAAAPHAQGGGAQVSGAQGGSAQVGGAQVGGAQVGSAQVGSAQGDEREAERGLRGLVGAGSSQVSVTAAMRARDAARPTPADLAEAEAELVIVRRGWVPREPLTK